METVRVTLSLTNDGNESAITLDLAISHSVSDVFTDNVNIDVAVSQIMYNSQCNTTKPNQTKPNQSSNTQKQYKSSLSVRLVLPHERECIH